MRLYVLTRISPICWVQFNFCFKISNIFCHILFDETLNFCARVNFLLVHNWQLICNVSNSICDLSTSFLWPGHSFFDRLLCLPMWAAQICLCRLCSGCVYSLTFTQYVLIRPPWKNGIAATVSHTWLVTKVMLKLLQPTRSIFFFCVDYMRVQFRYCRCCNFNLTDGSETKIKVPLSKSKWVAISVQSVVSRYIEVVVGWLFEEFLMLHFGLISIIA